MRANVSLQQPGPAEALAAELAPTGLQMITVE